MPEIRPLVSIVIPCRDEERHIGPCLESIIQGDYPHDRLEVLVVDGRSRDRTCAIVATYASRYPFIQLMDNAAGIVSSALNQAIHVARGEIIARMDAHATYSRIYLSTLVDALIETGADNVGGVIRTLPASSRPLARAIATALSHPLGVGNAYFRIGASERRWVDTVPFGCFRRDLFDRIGFFDEELIRNQDDEFNFRIARRGGRVLLEPRATAAYEARASFRQLGRMYYQYGYFKPLVARKVGRIMTARQLAPALLVGGLGASAVAAFWSTAAFRGFLCIGGIYVALLLWVALRAVRRYGTACATLLPAAFAVIHIAYGTGFLRGIWDHAPPRRRAMRVAPLPLSR